MPSVLVATSTGLYRLPVEQELVGEPVVGVSAPAGAGPFEAWAVTESWQEVLVGSGEVSIEPVRRPATGDRPACVLHVGARGVDRLIGTTGAHLLACAAPGAGQPFDPLPSFDAIPDRASWTQPWGAPPDLRSLAVLRSIDPDPQDPVVLLANAHVGGVARSDDGGTTWTPLVEVGIDVHEVATRSPATIVLATGAAAFGVSRDGGATWTFSSEGLHGGYCRAVAVAGDLALVSASSGPHASDGALYRRPIDDDDPFERVGGGLPASFGSNLDSRHVAVAPDGATIAVVTDDGTVFGSEDGTRTWDAWGKVPGRPRQVVMT